MKFIISILAAFALALTSADAQQPTVPISKPIVYNHVTEESALRDQAERKAYSQKFTIVDLPASSVYSPPRPTAGGLPTIAHTKSGEVLAGYVLVAYIVTTDGRAIEPVVLKSTDKRLNSAALKAMDAWRFEPARLNGAPISTTAAQEFTFKLP